MVSVWNGTLHRNKLGGHQEIKEKEERILLWAVAILIGHVKGILEVEVTSESWI